MSALKSKSGSFLARLPFLIVAILLGLATVFAAAMRFTEYLAISPWEPAIAMEAVPFNAGNPLYEAGRATHMYGPALTVFLAGIFRVTGLSLLAARVVFSLFSFALAGLLGSVLCRGNLKKYWLVAFLLFLGVNLRTNLIFFSAQADCVAALFAVSALVVWIANGRSWLTGSASILLFLIGMLLKQTSAAFALIPVAYCLMWQRWLPVAIRSVIPAACLFGALAAIYLLWPQMFFGMVTVPASININYDRVLPMLGYAVIGFPIFVMSAVGGYFLREKMDDTERWTWAAIAVLVPISVWTTCKSGGGYSSLLFGYLAMTSLFVIKLDSMRRWMESLRFWGAVTAAFVVAMVILFSFFIQFKLDMAILFARHGDDKYDVAISVARKLGDGVVSPQDPTIAYRANEYIGRSLFFELDTHVVNGNWPNELPTPILQELSGANFVITVRSYVPTPVFTDSLALHGFRLLNVPELTGSAYQAWGRDR